MKKIYLRIITLTRIFLKEQFKEPIALFWIILSPCAMFYLIVLSKNDPLYLAQRYETAAGWYFSYVASSVAFFGLSLYIIGRRESGFIRSFVYTPSSRLVFLCAQFLACTLIAFTYCTAFYLASRPLFGPYNAPEFFDILARFYLCYLLFCIPGLLISLLPINFQQANTLMSILSFSMLGLGLAGSIRPQSVIEKINVFNPITMANSIMENGLESNVAMTALILANFAGTVLITYKLFRINPVWNRY